MHACSYEIQIWCPKVKMSTRVDTSTLGRNIWMLHLQACITCTLFHQIAQMTYQPITIQQEPYQSNTNNVLVVQIGCNWRQILTYEVWFIGLETMHLLAIFLRVHRNRADPHLSTSTEHANCNLAYSIHHTNTLLLWQISHLARGTGPRLKSPQHCQEFPELIISVNA